MSLQRNILGYYAAKRRYILGYLVASAARARARARVRVGCVSQDISLPRQNILASKYPVIPAMGVGHDKLSRLRNNLVSDYIPVP